MQTFFGRPLNEFSVPEGKHGDEEHTHKGDKEGFAKHEKKYKPLFTSILSSSFDRCRLMEERWKSRFKSLDGT
jgi:hypothetical protein